MLQIESVEIGSDADHCGLRAGDRIQQVNDRPVRDLLDFHFVLADEPEATLEVQRGRDSLRLELRRNGGGLGLAFAPLRTRLCGNECVFCFIDQNPTGMRESLYVKDEDYRLSFLHGNFVTLTNMKEWEIRRIVEQRLTPLYISVHSTNPEIRRRLLRPKVDRDILPILEYFRQNEIVMHTQVVLCPGFNDGEDLLHTIRDMAAFHPSVQSLAVVPLGMTDHREGLETLAPVTRELAESTLREVEAQQAEYQRSWGNRFVYMADEWYRLLGRKVPPATHYDGFPQIENGIGMTREFLNGVGRLRKVFPFLPAGEHRRVLLLTGSLFRGTLEGAIRDKLARTGETVEVEVVGVENRFFGPRVTVAGLLSGRDLVEAARSRGPADLVMIPPATLNDDQRFLDDMTMAELTESLQVPVRAGFRNRYW